MKAVYFVYFIPLVVAGFLIARWDPFSLTIRNVWETRSVLGTVALIAIFGGLIFFHPLSAPVADGKLHVDFLDVGQGDASLITFPNGKTMLIDAGGRPDYRKSYDDEERFEPDVPRIGEAVVSEFLWEKGISHIDMIVATHADADHIQGLSDIVRNFGVGFAYLGRIDDDPELKLLLREIERSGAGIARWHCESGSPPLHRPGRGRIPGAVIRFAPRRQPTRFRCSSAYYRSKVPCRHSRDR